MKAEFIDNPSSLIAVLKSSEKDDIDILVDYITAKGEGRITLEDKVCQRLVACKNSGGYSESDLSLISFEIRRFGGNTLTNLYRDARNAVPWGSVFDSILPEVGNAVGYDEVVRDVASHLKVSVNKESSVPTMEDGILRKILADTFAKMSPEEQKALLAELNVSDLSLLKPVATAALLGAGKLAGFATYKIALIVANAVAKAILGRGLSLGANALLTRTIGVLLGPVGWVLTGLWTLADMASPAYRVTVPCVVQVAYMRQKALIKAYASECKKCGAPNTNDAKFCSDCGSPMQS